MGLPLLAAVGEVTGKPTVVLEKDLTGWKEKYKFHFPLDIQNLKHISMISRRDESCCCR